MRLQEPTTSQPPAPAPASGLVVEHQAWREARDQVFAAIRAGQGLVLLSGPPGTGKTLLLQELTRMLRAAGFDALLQPRGDIPVEPGHSGEGERIRPRVVLVDEADRMDEAVLERLGRLRARSLVLAGLTKARRWPAGPSVTTVSLTPLEASEAGRFLAARLSQAGQPADRFAPDVVARLAEQAGGVPRKREFEVMGLEGERRRKRRKVVEGLDGVVESEQAESGAEAEESGGEEAEEDDEESDSSGSERGRSPVASAEEEEEEEED